MLAPHALAIWLEAHVVPLKRRIGDIEQGEGRAVPWLERIVGVGSDLVPRLVGDCAKVNEEVLK